MPVDVNTEEIKFSRRKIVRDKELDRLITKLREAFIMDFMAVDRKLVNDEVAYLIRQYENRRIRRAVREVFDA